VDNTQNIISFCTGYSGLELGIKRAGVDVRTICYLEIEVYVQAVLVKAIQEGRLCPAPIWTNVKSFDARPFRGVVDGITGGFPCQPFSSAGKRKGQEDPRHLWPSIANSIRLCRPGWVFLENVPGLVTLGLRDVLQDLGQMGYRTTWNIFSAEEVGAPHQRKRVFILAKLPDTNLTGLEGETSERVQGREGRGEQYEVCESTRRGGQNIQKQLGNTTSLRPHRGSENCEGEQSEVLGERLESDEELGNPSRQGSLECGEQGEVGSESETTSGERCESSPPFKHAMSAHHGGATQWPARPGEEQYEWEEPRVTEAQSFMGGATNGTQHRVDRLRLLGNGVVPQTAELAWKTLWKEMNATCHTK